MSKPNSDSLRSQVERIINQFGLRAAFHGINKERNPIPKDPTDELMELISNHSLQERIDEIKRLDRHGKSVNAPRTGYRYYIEDRIKQLEDTKEKT